MTGGTKDQLRVFLSGEGGTGKSKVLKLVMEFARLHYGRTEGLHGPVLAMGPTGPSSHNIKGFTYHSVVGLSSSSTKAHKITQMTAKAKGETIRGVKLFIIDEISLVGKEDLGILEQRLKASFLTTIQDPIERDARKHLPFAGVHFILCGDFYQLPPVFNKIPLYSPLFSEGIKHVEKKKLQMAGQDVWQSINAFSELIFNFRANSDHEGTKQLAQALTRLRLGHVTVHDLALLNTKIIISNKERENFSKNTLYLCPTKEMVQIKNKEEFKKLLDNNAYHFRCVAIHKQSETFASPPDKATTETLLKHYGGPSDDILPPYLDLAIGTRVRITKNLATIIGTGIKLCRILLNIQNQVLTMELLELLLLLASKIYPPKIESHQPQLSVRTC